MADLVNFKVFLSRGGYEEADNPEIRRFGIDSDVVTNYTYLREKLQAVFPNLKGERFTITWQDVDGDYVLISSTEELQIALMETQDLSVRKLYVKLHPSEPENKQPPPQQQQQQQSFPAQRVNLQGQEEPKVQHAGVVCDGCDSGIYGFRYKCLQCPDYDLCHECEIKCLHPEHCMLRISVPRQWKSHYGKRLSHQLNKFMKRAGMPPRESGQQQDDDLPKQECPFKSSGGSSSSSKRFSSSSTHHGSSRSRPTSTNCDQPSWLDILSTYLNDWANLPGECPGMQQEQENKSTQAGKDEAAGPSSSTTGKPPGSGKKTPSSPDTHIEFLKNIGENIAQFLDPLGIDVSVAVKTDVKTNTTTTADAGSSTDPPPAQSPKSDSPKNAAPHSTAKTQSKPAAAQTGAAGQVPQNKPAELQPKPPKKQVTIVDNGQAKPSAPQKPAAAEDINDEWTFISNDVLTSSASSNNSFTDLPPSFQGSNSQNVSSKPPAFNKEGNEKNAESSPKPAETTRTNLYPSLNPGISDNIWHSNPKIQRAVEAMMQMGFTNENGWLTHLLIKNDGDISKVLDLLQPVNN